LYNHKEYEPDKITPKHAIVEAKKLILKIPTNNKNSPRKLLVLGKAILAKIKAKKKKKTNKSA